MRYIRVVLGWLVIVALLVMMRPITAFAAISSCHVDSTPHTVAPSTQVAFQLTVTNEDPTEDVQFVRILRPSGDFTIQSVSATDWTTDVAAEEATLAGSALSPGQSFVITVTADVGGTDADASNWSVFTSDSGDGSGSTFCDGEPWVEITSGTVLSVSQAAASGVTATGAVITWNSNRPADSRVEYGKTSSYGSTAVSSDNSLLTDHQVTLSGLQPETTYHYRVRSVDSGGSVAYSGDNTFVTLTAPVVPSTGGGGGGSTSTTSTTATPRIASVPIVPGDKVPPTIVVDTRLSGAYKTPPAVTGSAADDVGVAGVEYSTDGGKNWLPAEELSGVGAKNATFRITFPPMQDGDYSLIVRAVDLGRNTKASTSQVLVIDRLPPIMGANVVSFGPQTVYPDDRSRITALAGADQKIVMSSVGGPIAVTIDAIPVGQSKVSNSFTLSKSAASGLWLGMMTFSKGGDFDLKVRARDGAGNVTERPLFSAHVLPRASVFRAGSSQKLKATTTVYFRDPETSAWVKWDAAAYGQENPQRVDDKAEYGYYVPAGTYYIKYEAPGYQTQVSRSIKVNGPTGLTQDVYLRRRPGIHVGKISLGIPWVSLAEAPYEQSVTSKVRSGKSDLPTLQNFRLPQTNQQPLAYSALFGKPTIMTFVNSWAPASQDQLAILGTMTNPDIRVLAVSSGESVSRASVYAALSGYPLPILVDSDNQLAQNLRVSFVPVHYFVDRHGVVKKVRVGILSKEELIRSIVN